MDKKELQKQARIEQVNYLLDMMMLTDAQRLYLRMYRDWEISSEQAAQNLNMSANEFNTMVDDINERMNE